MRKLMVILLCLAMPSGASAAQPNIAAPQRNFQFLNGRWFDGRKFTVRIFYSAGGTLTSKKPARVDSVIDLKGGYVVPPFGEAHNHNVEGARPEKVIRTYLEDGIFYVKNPNNLPRSRTALAGKVNIPTSVDVVFANGGLTSAGGHPAGLVRRNISREIFTEADAEGAFYYEIDSETDLERKWGAVLAGKPDFIKTYLLYSEEYAKRKGDESFFGRRGLNPALLPGIVSKAHSAGLRVSAHVESAADFHNALAAGVDEINHMPGFRGDANNEFPDPAVYEIAEADAKLAARKGTFVVTTLGGFRQLGEENPARRAAQALFVRNLRLLSKHSVRIAIGSDSYRETSAPEARFLASLKVFDNLTLLKTWCETTAETIFPGRRIGRLKDGYEASFLVLAGDPLRDFANTGRIEMRFKQGELLSLK
ncbi:MAG TPA: amidohydrolase family protein [Pyrinomonadaceae bacterium]|nr:amidohydrolase family protein [Pyrinomonadaceae bacterium]